MGGLYCQMADRGELITHPGRPANVGAFIRDVAEDLGEGVDVKCIGSDRARKAEFLEAIRDSGVRWPPVARGTGAHAFAKGTHDVRAFERAVLEGPLALAENLVIRSAIASSTLRFDAGGNPALVKGRADARIDALQAAVIAVGLGTSFWDEPEDWCGLAQ